MPANKPIDYQALNAELDKLVHDLQAGELNIDEALKAYERGVEIIEQLQSHLKVAENRVTKINQDFN